MESLRNLYRIGTGPSSSHTMGPRQAAQQFLRRCPDAKGFRVTLYASLAATGRGHLTDKALQDVLGEKPLELLWQPQQELPLHPNGMRFEALDSSDQVISTWEVYSIGGGALKDSDDSAAEAEIYPHKSLGEILEHTAQSGESLWEYVFNHEDRGFPDFLAQVWDIMSSAIGNGLSEVGVIHGGLGLSRKAHVFFRKSTLYSSHLQNNARIWAYALAVAEENATGGLIVTAPTCGACGTLPAVLRYLQESLSCSHEDIIRALATAGLIGNLVKYNASISGAEVGCQGEVGTACAMAAAAAAQLHGGTARQIEYAAEMGLEHHLGLTCDPVGGLVQIPCIERNAHAASRAVSCSHYALLSGGEHIITFDEITKVMKETGHALPSIYRETSEGGIAEAYRRRAQRQG